MNKEIALGCMRIANMSFEEVENLILYALEEGVNFFDHADIYGNRRCEELFGLVLKKHPTLRSKMTIQSKCGICNGYYDFSKEHIINQTLESINLMNCDYLDILLLHRPDALADYDEICSAFNYLYENGYVRSFGVSNMNSWQIELFRKKVSFPVVANQIQFSLVHSHIINQGIFVNMVSDESIDRSSGVLEYCQLHDIKIQAWSSLMASWTEGSFIEHENYPRLNNVLSELANKYQVSKNSIAIAWILRHPANIMPIVGTTSKEHLKEICQARNITLTRQEWYALYLAVGHQLP